MEKITTLQPAKGEHKSRAIFLDRDGTINSDEGHYYIYKKEDFVFNPGVIDGIRRLNEAGYLVIVVTNQGGVAKGEYTIEDVEAVHAYMCAELKKHGARIDKIYYCHHHDSVAPCSCRKPAPGMIEQAIREFDIDKSASLLIGDGGRDIEAAEAAGIRGIKIKKNSDLTPVIDHILKESL
ncbi:HAD family hydrolase [Butyricimonas hominis]|mgnify:FL=1|uniref:D,D-heptose 1,7-bisphosphate phosphatase n=1 Tax=Butyricimonas hominis TaxID=2763032 RepID=A0ABR7CY53_9BACT|nr:HAD family hydrolase [Butyricimonas hominis]MBC5620615.1 HAD family hydrolase [Butyricimonas hominis]